MDESGNPTHPTSPLKTRNRTRALEFENVILDMCHLTVTLSPKSLSSFAEFLTSEGVGYYRLQASHPLSRSTLKIISPDHFHRLVCKLPGRIQKVVYN